MTIKLFYGKEALQFIDQVAELRINIFREYPYLYDGDLSYEKKYLAKFIDVEDSIIAIAFDTDQVVGALTGLPLQAEETNINQPWLEKGFNLEDKFYFSEGLLFKSYRRKGFGSRLFREAENWVRSKEKYTAITLATVIRPNDHPSKPADYQSTDIFWEKLGYRKMEGIICHIPWKEIGATVETDKPLQFWYEGI